MNFTGFKILSQSVQISQINFEQSNFRVSTELAIIALRSDLIGIALSLGEDCILPNDPTFGSETEIDGRVTVENVDAIYYRNKFRIQCPDTENERNLLALKNAFSEAKEAHDGDLIIEIPENCLVLVQNQKVMRVNVDLVVSKPKEGVKFNFDKSGGSADDTDRITGACIFTYRSNPLSSTKHWLPCAEQSSQLCVWRFEITVPKQLTAICCGDLVDTVASDDGLQKTFHYQLLVPTSAVNIGFAIGDFQMYVQPEMPEIISFVLHELMPLLRHTMSSLNRIFVFFEEFLSCRFPYGTYWQIIVDQIPDELTTYAGLSIFSLKILYHKKILDIVQPSRKVLARAVAQQFFGCFINSADFGEIWLTLSLSSYITGIFIERFFGTCEYLYQLNCQLKEACEYEARMGPITLCTKAEDYHMEEANGKYFDHLRPDTCSFMYLDALAKKGQILLRMLEKRLPKEQFTKVLQRILSVGMQHCQNLNRPIEWSQLLISTKTFVRTVTDVTGQEFPTFIDQWIYTGGFVDFTIQHTFNRKRNMIELELRQAHPAPIGRQIYAGPLTIIVQEIDGHFVHTIQVDAAVSKHDIQCHSKGRKLKRKKILMGTGEEVEMDLSQMDADSPVLWIRIDPEMLLYRQISIGNQPFYQWEFLLLYERDVLAQQQAVEALYKFARHQTRDILEDTVRNEKFFYRIRRDAALALVHIYNSLPDSQLGESPPLIDFIKQKYCCKTCPEIPQPNNYVATSANLQNYSLLQSLPSAIGSIRGQMAGKSVCPDYIVDFLVGLLRLNDNSINRYSDDYYRAALIHALGKTLVISEQPVKSPEEMNAHARTVLEEVTHALNMDTMKPSFGRVISTHCLQVLYELQRCQHIPLDTEVFWKFGLSKNVNASLRFAALACIVAMIRRNRLQLFVRTIQRLIEVVLTDPDPFIRHSLAQRLCIQPPFEHRDNPAQYPQNTPIGAAALVNYFHP